MDESNPTVKKGSGLLAKIESLQTSDPVNTTQLAEENNLPEDIALPDFPVDDTPAFEADTELPDIGNLSLPDDIDFEPESPASNTEISFDSFPDTDIITGSTGDLSFEEEEPEPPFEASTEPEAESPVFETFSEEDTPAFESFSEEAAPSFDSFAEPEAEAPAFEPFAETADETIATGDDLILPDFDVEAPSEDETFAFDMTASDEDLSFDSFPDTDLDLSVSDTELENPELSDNIFNDEVETEEEYSSPMAETQNFAASGGGLSFTGLYDKETLMGESSTTEEVKKKTKVPVIICIICAAICLIATTLLLFIIPSKYNLIKRTVKVDENTVIIEATPVTPNDKQNLETEKNQIVQLADLANVSPAKENEIVIVEKAEDVIPVPPVVNKQRTTDVTYKIKWGDTLWDISNTFYKTPWKYQKIATYNKIKNPDHIISGTVITIPAE